MRRWDNLVNLLQRLVESLLFFHPAVWLVSGWMRREREACCDAIVVGHTNRRRAYAELLVALASQRCDAERFSLSIKRMVNSRGRGRPGSLASAMAAAPLRNRIRYILQLEDDSMRITGKSFAFVLAGLLTAAILAVLYLPTQGQAEESATEATEITEESEESAESADVAEEAGATEIQIDSPTDRAEIDAEDDWLRDADFASEKERKIAQRAWKELGVKALPLTEAELEELRRGGFRGGLKLIGLDEVMNTEGPLILTHFHSKRLTTGIANFAALERALDALASQPVDELLVLQGKKKGGGIFQYSMRRPQAPTPTQSPGGSAESHERRVLGTFQIDPYNPGELFRAVEEAHAEKLYVDIVQNEDKWDLVVVPAPTESNWPALLGQPPRKERVIADKAWARLGLKLVPASRLEQLAFTTHRVGGPIKILGGNVPDGLPLPAFLRRVGDQTFETFDDLHAWLNAQEGKRPIAVKAYAFADGHEYLFDASPTGDAMIQAQGPNRSNQKFPSLEDQKLADLAWRMLQLELEPIGSSNAAALGPSQNEDLRRVRALGYSEGLLVTGTSQPGGGLKNYFEVQRGDILVGLHVWPTTSLEEVADILTRDDLASLSPLKFYVVRADQSDTDKGQVVTGRITVRTQSMQASGGGSSTEAATVEIRGQASPEPTVEPRAANIPRDNWPAIASENEIKVLEEHIKTLQSQFERIDALFKAGRRGGNASIRALAAYELAVAKGEQALMQGQHAQAIERFNEAQAQAEGAFKAMSADYEAGNTTYDVVLLTAKNLADIKRKIIQLKQQQTGSTREASPTIGGTRDGNDPFSRAIRSEATPQSNESISVLKKFVEREGLQYGRLEELAANNAVSTAEVETQKSNYEISLARLQQAQRALEYHKAMVAMAAAEYETALDGNKKAPGAVSESDLRKLQLKVQAAEAKYKELAE